MKKILKYNSLSDFAMQVFDALGQQDQKNAIQDVLAQIDINEDLRKTMPNDDSLSEDRDELYRKLRTLCDAVPKYWWLEPSEKKGEEK